MIVGTSEEFDALAKLAIRAVEARKDEDIEEWARRLAEDVSGVDD